MRRKIFRRPDKYVAGRFDDWREIIEDGGAVQVFLGTCVTWPPHQRQRNESKPASFEAECEGTLARRYVEVDFETGRPLVAPTEAELIARDLKQHPRLALDALRHRLTKTTDPRAVLAGITQALRAVESDIDEHDSPFPSERDVPPDHGALRAWQEHFKQLRERAELGQDLSEADRAFAHPALSSPRS